MSVKPILFNTDMVRAILDGRKTVTRRLVKPQPTGNYFTGVCTGSTQTGDKAIGQFFWGESQGGISESARPPYQLEDILYIRETFVKSDDGYHYRADATPDSERIRVDYGYKYRPSIHMPKEAARIWLNVINVRAEKLQDITEEQAIKEGCCTFQDKTGNGKFNDVIEFDLTARDAFAELWNGTLRKDSNCTWAHNPWVWVIEFERCEKPEQWEG